MYEIKNDGFRALAYLENGSVRLVSRRGHARLPSQRAEFEYSLKTMSAKRALTLGSLRVCAKNTETGTPANLRSKPHFQGSYSS